MNKLIFVDTSAHYAIINKDDIDHLKAVNFLKELAREKAILLCSNFIISEVYTLIMRKVGRENAIHYVQNLRKSTRIERISEKDEKHAWKIILKYQDKDFSYVDATSFALMERLRINKAFSFDDHFSQYDLIKLP